MSERFESAFEICRNDFRDEHKWTMSLLGMTIRIGMTINIGILTLGSMSCCAMSEFAAVVTHVSYTSKMVTVVA